MMGTTFARGAAAALMTIGTAATLGAQTGGGFGRGRESRDTVVFRAFGPEKLDSMTMVMRAIEREPYGSSAWFDLTHRLDSLMAFGAPMIVLRGKMPGFAWRSDQMPKGWIGFNAQGAQQIMVDTAGYRVTYYAHPSILSVDPQSPADRAGIVPGDVLIAFNGTDVIGHEFNLTRLFVPEKRLAVTVRRDGENKDYSLDVVRAPEGVFNRRMEFTRIPGIPMSPDVRVGTMQIEIPREGGERVERLPRIRMGGGPLMVGRFAVIGPHGVLGANVSPVNEDLAKALRLPKGMLVNDAPEQSPAYKSGLRAGDVIVSVSGQPVSTLGELQDQVMANFGDRSFIMQVMRNKKPVKLTVSW